MVEITDPRIIANSNRFTVTTRWVDLSEHSVPFNKSLGGIKMAGKVLKNFPIKLRRNMAGNWVDSLETRMVCSDVLNDFICVNNRKTLYAVFTVKPLPDSFKLTSRGRVKEHPGAYFYGAETVMSRKYRQGYRYVHFEQEC
jgi:hypothetical protein